MNETHNPQNGGTFPVGGSHNAAIGREGGAPALPDSLGQNVSNPNGAPNGLDRWGMLQQPTPSALGSDADAANPFAGMTQAPPATLGSQPAAPNPFGAFAQPMDGQMPAQLATQPQVAPPIQQAHPQPPVAPPQQAPAVPAAPAENPIAAMLAEQGIEAQPVSIYTRPPVFSYGSVTEDIEDTAQTFEDLRAAKQDDFPELEDAIRVSWEVVYGKIRKTISGSDAKKKKIGEIKAAIETSKEFTDALKKSKDKQPVCTVKPRVTAQSKGEQMAGYKGVFASLEEAEASTKVISFVPARDGKVYERRRLPAGTFTVPVQHCAALSEVKAGFTPALPLIPHELLMQVVTFFRSLLFSDNGNSYEAIVNIYWDTQLQLFEARVPRQRVSPVRAVSQLSEADEMDAERYLHYMDIHSHNVMAAQFSMQDNRDEKATRLYAVIGQLDAMFPEISVRMGCGGRHLPIAPHEIFETAWYSYPKAWDDQISFDDALIGHPDGIYGGAA